MNIPQKCKLIFEILQNNGFECYAVGGCVRDSIMGQSPQDWDFTTDALPDDICRCFSQYTTIDIGRDYGTICVVIDSEPFEITTYRCDGEYTDSRHPDSVTFTRNLIDDLARRDFTINSIAYSPATGFVDPYGGIKDIDDGIIRCTGIPYDRFSEDALRILRALRFSARLGFDIEKQTASAIHNLKDNLKAVHPQRIRKELTGILVAADAPSVISEYQDVMAVIIPEIEPMSETSQNNPHHCYNVWEHTVKALENTPSDELVRFAVFFHDIGKPSVKSTDSKGIDHFTKHQTISAELTSQILRRFGFPSKFVKDVSLLVKYHDERFRNSGADIKRILSIIGEDLFFKLMDVIYADISAQSDYQREDKFNLLKSTSEQAKTIIASGECYTLSALAVNGSDLIKMGFKGKAISHSLSVLLKLVIKGKAENTKESLLFYANSLPRVLED